MVFLRTKQGQNVIMLFITQASNYLFPIIVTPLLIRKLGIDTFGEYSFVLAIIVFMGIILDYAFALTGVNGIAKTINSKSEMQIFYREVQSSKILLIFVCLFLLPVIIFATQGIVINTMLIPLQFLCVAISAFTPIYVFQGLEHLKEVTKIVILGKIVTIILLFYLVQESNDVNFVPFSYLIGNVFTLFLSTKILNKWHGLKFKFVGVRCSLQRLKTSSSTFVGMSFASLYRDSIPVLLGVLSNNEAVGYYVLAEKVMKAIQGVQAPFGQALFPYLSKIHSFKAVKLILTKHSKIVVFIYFFVATLVFFLSSEIINIVAGSVIKNAGINLKILSFVIFLGGLNYYFGFLMFMPTEKAKMFLQALKYTGMVSILAASVLCFLLQDFGASIALCVSEIIMLILIARNIKLCQSQ